MKTYILTISYNEDTDEVEYLKEEVLCEETTFEMGELDISEYFDDEALEMIENEYIVGEC